MPLQIPQPPFISSVTSNSFVVTVTPDGNPVGTFYAIQVIFSGTGGFVDSTGTIQPVQLWINTTMITVKNTTPGTNYSVRLAAANDSIGTNATAFGTVTSFTTLTGVNGPNPSQFSTAEQEVISQSRKLMPEIFSRNTQDYQILAFANLILADINLMPPLTNFTIDSVVTNPNLANLLYFGISLFADLFFQQRATLEDFQYNDNGISLNITQVEKINQSYVNMLQFFNTMKTNFKKTQIFVVGAQGLGTPRFQSQIGQFLKISLGSAFSWNTP
jgi:hypothetical protein